jgi:hypothetical protein
MIGIYFAGLEAAMRTIIPERSNSARREQQDYQSAVNLTPAKNGHARLLFVGNSLLLHGVDRKVLRDALASADIAVLPIENTSVLDWQFGLQRLFADGARPSTVVLSINARQLASDATNGERFAWMLMRRRDLGKVARASGLDNTTVSAYYFATYSAWLGNREGFRNWLLEQWLPNAHAMVQLFTPRTEPPPDEQILAAAIPRLQELRDLCRAHGANFIYVVPASLNARDAASAIVEAAERAGVSAIMPFAPGEMPPGAFGDGFHLNQEGARKFTGRLSPMLQAALSAAD